MGTPTRWGYANQSIMMLSDVIRYSKSNNSEVENEYDLDVDAKGIIVLLQNYGEYKISYTIAADL